MAIKSFKEGGNGEGGDRKRPYDHFKFPDEIIITMKKMSTEEENWHSDRPVRDGKVWMATTTNYGWFPTKVLMGTTKHMFDKNHSMSVSHGASIGVNTGSASILVHEDGLEKAVKTLRDAGYTVNIIY